MDPWYKVATPRKEVREGRSFNPDEFAIHLEQVIAKTAPEDYRDPAQFFGRTCFTRALRDHVGMVLRRLSGETMDDLLEIRPVILVEAVGDYKRLSMIRIIIQFVIPIHGMTGSVVVYVRRVQVKQLHHPYDYGGKNSSCSHLAQTTQHTA